MFVGALVVCLRTNRCLKTVSEQIFSVRSLSLEVSYIFAFKSLQTSVAQGFSDHGVLIFQFARVICAVFFVLSPYICLPSSLIFSVCVDDAVATIVVGHELARWGRCVFFQPPLFVSLFGVAGSLEPMLRYERARVWNMFKTTFACNQCLRRKCVLTRWMLGVWEIRACSSNFRISGMPYDFYAAKSYSWTMRLTPYDDGRRGHTTWLLLNILTWFASTLILKVSKFMSAIKKGMCQEVRTIMVGDT